MQTFFYAELTSADMVPISPTGCPRTVGTINDMAEISGLRGAKTGTNFYCANCVGITIPMDIEMITVNRIISSTTARIDTSVLGESSHPYLILNQHHASSRSSHANAEH